MINETHVEMAFDWIDYSDSFVWYNCFSHESTPDSIHFDNSKADPDFTASISAISSCDHSIWTLVMNWMRRSESGEIESIRSIEEEQKTKNKQR